MAQVVMFQNMIGMAAQEGWRPLEERLARCGACGAVAGMALWILGAAIWARAETAGAEALGKGLFFGGIGTVALAKMYYGGMETNWRRVVVHLVEQAAFAVFVMGAIYWARSQTASEEFLGQMLLLGGLAGHFVFEMASSSLSFGQTPHWTLLAAGLLAATWIAGAVFIARAQHPELEFAGKVMLGMGLPLGQLVNCISLSMIGQRARQRQPVPLPVEPDPGVPVENHPPISALNLVPDWREQINQRHRLIGRMRIQPHETPYRALARLSQINRNDVETARLADLAIADLRIACELDKRPETLRVELAQLRVRGEADQLDEGLQGAMLNLLQRYRELEGSQFQVKRDPLRQFIEDLIRMPVGVGPQSIVTQLGRLLLANPTASNEKAFLMAQMEKLSSLLADRTWQVNPEVSWSVGRMVVGHLSHAIVQQPFDTQLYSTAVNLLAGWSQLLFHFPEARVRAELTRLCNGIRTGLPTNRQGEAIALVGLWAGSMETAQGTLLQRIWDPSTAETPAPAAVVPVAPVSVAPAQPAAPAEPLPLDVDL
jgi:hypothetical protein